MIAIVSSATITEVKLTTSGILCIVEMVASAPPAGASTPRNGNNCVMIMITPIPLMNPDTTGYGM